MTIPLKSFVRKEHAEALSKKLDDMTESIFNSASHQTTGIKEKSRTIDINHGLSTNPEKSESAFFTILKKGENTETNIEEDIAAGQLFE